MCFFVRLWLRTHPETDSSAQGSLWDMEICITRTQSSTRETAANVMGLLLWCNTMPETASPSDLIKTAERPHTHLHVATEWAWKPQARLHLQHASLHLCRSSRMHLVKQEACSVAAVQLLDGVRFALTKRRKRKEGVFQFSASTPCIVCGAMCGRARQDSSCSLSRCFPCALPTDTCRSPRLCPATGNSSAHACCPILDYSNSNALLSGSGMRKNRTTEGLCDAECLLYSLAVNQGPKYSYLKG